MLTQLHNIVSNTNPKVLAAAIKKHPDLYQWVTSCYGQTIAEKVYNALNPGEQICTNGNPKKFNSITAGYRFCGPAGKCACAKEAVAAKVAASKAAKSRDEKDETNQKRAATNIERYGVANTGQTAQAKERHNAFYCSADNVQAVSAKVASTKKEKYGTSTYNNSSQIRETFKKKRQHGYWVSKFPEKNISTLESREELLLLFNSKNVVEIANELGVHIQTVYKYLNLHNIREPFKSADEKEIERFLLNNGITNVVRNTRKLLPSKKEIDFYLPDFNVAIEYNGVYWHHEDVNHITRDYHWRKFKECEELGIQLITIFSNFWHSKKEIVKQSLLNKLNIHQKYIHARKCQVRKLLSKEAKLFLETNHIQGYTPAQIVYGLYYCDDLVAVMSFSKSRSAIGSKSNDIELVRYASAGRVIGGASRLLCAFRNDHPAVDIISYSDNEWSTGHLYQTLGFRLESDVKPSYWYLKPNEHKLYHRYTFNKQKLVALGYDPALTEAQITKEMGLLKVWDCGKKKWALRL